MNKSTDNRKITASGFTFFILFIWIAGCTGSSGAIQEDVEIIDISEVSEPEEKKKILETQPQIIGGMQGLYRNLEYPQDAIAANIEGSVKVLFVVNKNGRTSHIRVSESSGHRSLDNAAVNAVRRTRFIPGTQEGEPVHVRLTVPVTFRLQ